MAEVHVDAVALRDVEFSYGPSAFALQCPRLSIARGEAVALVGPSGSGKTTLLQLMAGIAVPSRGQVVVHGDEISAWPEALRRAWRLARVGLVFQELELLEHLSVGQNLMLPAVLRGDDVGRRQERAEELARASGVHAHLSRRPCALSAGERQRAAACRALLCEPTLVLADEPTGNLDHANAERLVDLLLSDVHARGATLVVVTHDRDLLRRFDRTVSMEDACR